MRERLRLLGGRLELSDGSSGTRVVALLPHWSPAR
jgi:signal transduction histidine kinase